jgi:phosphoribosylanthranilate isomerase
MESELMKAPVRVKFCGITRVEDALLAASLGASAIGLVFVEGSPRCVSRERAAEICSVLPPLGGTIDLSPLVFILLVFFIKDWLMIRLFYVWLPAIF